METKDDTSGSGWWTRLLLILAVVWVADACGRVPAVRLTQEKGSKDEKDEGVIQVSIHSLSPCLDRCKFKARR
jgi:hypothetical protein